MSRQAQTNRAPTQGLMRVEPIQQAPVPQAPLLQASSIGPALPPCWGRINRTAKPAHKITPALAGLRMNRKWNPTAFIVQSGLHDRACHRCREFAHCSDQGCCLLGFGPCRSEAKAGANPQLAIAIARCNPCSGHYSSHYLATSCSAAVRTG